MHSVDDIFGPETNISFKCVTNQDDSKIKLLRHSYIPAIMKDQQCRCCGDDISKGEPMFYYVYRLSRKHLSYFYVCDFCERSGIQPII